MHQYEHKRNLLQKNILNALVAHCKESAEYLDLERLSKSERKLLKQKCLEYAFIARSTIVNLRPGFKTLPISS